MSESQDAPRENAAPELIYIEGLVALGALLEAAISNGKSASQAIEFSNSVLAALSLVPKEMR